MSEDYRLPRRRLRKQPKMRRLQSASATSRGPLAVPKTARQRRRRNSRGMRLSTMAFKRLVLSSRWISLGLLFLSVYALVLIGSDEHFYLTLIPVEGTVSIPPETIVESSGLAGIHAFAADPGVAARRIAELPGVIAASVTLQWPNQASIQIVEDSPIAVWREGGNQFWITADGNLIPSSGNANGLLLIESEMPLSPEGADEKERTRPSLSFVPRDVLSGALLLRELRPNIDKLSYRPSNGLSFQDGRGWRVHFGTGNDMEQKLVVYETLLEDILGRELTPSYISVSNQKKPYYLAN